MTTDMKMEDMQAQIASLQEMFKNNGKGDGAGGKGMKDCKCTRFILDVRLLTLYLL